MCEAAICFWFGVIFQGMFYSLNFWFFKSSKRAIIFLLKVIFEHESDTKSIKPKLILTQLPQDTLSEGESKKHPRRC